VTTMERSRKEQRRDLALFLKFMELNEKTDARTKWTYLSTRKFFIRKDIAMMQKKLKNKTAYVNSERDI
jgi:hypothetical protein